LAVKWMEEQERKEFDQALNMTAEELFMAQLAAAMEEEQLRQAQVRRIAEVG